MTPAELQRSASEKPGLKQADEIHVSYLGWRLRCISVQETYFRWIEAAQDERAAAFAAYVAALEREERSATSYAALVRSAVSA